MLALIESTARATIKHSDSEPIASAAATASVNADEAVVALWPLKPAAPDGRIMVWIPLKARANHLRHRKESRNARGQHWGGCRFKKWQKRGKAQHYARYSLGD
jgi:hypothetical protein